MPLLRHVAAWACRLPGLKGQSEWVGIRLPVRIRFFTPKGDLIYACVFVFER